jgi:hypothetical protein
MTTLMVKTNSKHKDFTVLTKKFSIVLSKKNFFTSSHSSTALIPTDINSPYEHLTHT